MRSLAAAFVTTMLTAPILAVTSVAPADHVRRGLQLLLAAGEPGTTSGGLHTPTYTGDDAAIPVGIRAMAALVLDYLTPPAR
jgi:hypothetical protein